MHSAAQPDYYQQRPLPFSIAYRMPGSVAEAEDMVPKSFLRFQQAGAQADSAKSYLVSVATRPCIDHLRSARAQRESYVGPWLPEPLAMEKDRAELVSALSLAPAGRAVFLLREVFDDETIYPVVNPDKVQRL